MSRETDSIHNPLAVDSNKVRQQLIAEDARLSPVDRWMREAWFWVSLFIELASLWVFVSVGMVP